MSTDNRNLRDDTILETVIDLAKAALTLVVYASVFGVVAAMVIAFVS